MRRASVTAPPLYDPSAEHDACGVGFVADAGGRSASRVLPLALAGLASLGHRGAFAADGLSSDGAGVGLPLEPALLERLTAAFPPLTRESIGRRPAVLQLFLPRGRRRQGAARQIVGEALEEAGLRGTAWRHVPTDPSALGPTAFASRPDVWQLFVARPGTSSRGERTARPADARRGVRARAPAGPAPDRRRGCGGRRGRSLGRLRLLANDRLQGPRGRGVGSPSSIRISPGMSRCRSRPFTSGSRRTRIRRGTSRSPSAMSRTTARSIRSAAIARRSGAASATLIRPVSWRSCRVAGHCFDRVAPIPHRSTRPSSCSSLPAGRSTPHWRP